MNNKTDIEEDIERIKNHLMKIQQDTSLQIRISIENILADRERLKKDNENWEKYNLEKEEDITELNNKLFEAEAKANKYDSLVEKIKEDKSNLEFSRDLDADKGFGEDEEDMAVRRYIETLQELLDTEK